VRAERELWKSGVLSWDDARRLDAVLPPAKSRRAREFLRESERALDREDARYFANLIPPEQRWRLFRQFRRSVAYLDIETNGLGGPEGCITTAVLYDGESVSCYVRDDNLRDLRDDLRRYKLLVTYNGACFDLPFIESYFAAKVDTPHIDLRYLLRRLGVTGGLQACERQVGSERGDLGGLDGLSAVLLWRDYSLHGNERALETLLAYNIADAVNLERLMVFAWNREVTATPFAERSLLPEPRPPRVPFRADGATIERLALTGGFGRRR